MPTFDLSYGLEPYPHANGLKTEASGASSPPQWLSVAEYWELLNLVSPQGGAPTDSAAVMESLRGWVRADSVRARRFPANVILRAKGFSF
jgi:hypothetical protein